MLYKIAHFLQERFSFVWDFIEILNSWLFSLRYGRKLKGIQPILTKHQGDFIVREATLKDVDAIISFFEAQPKESFDFFKPHPFDAPTTKKLIKNRSYLFFIVLDGSQVVGYYFLRSFFMGKSYLGKLVDYRYRGKGIGKMMCLSAMEVAIHCGLRMYETISKDNLASLYSTQKVLDTRIIEEMEDNYIYIEDLPKGSLKE